MIIKDMPKIECPFVRERIGGRYLITQKITEGYNWVFEDNTVIAVEKLDGTCLSIIVENGTIIQIYNRIIRIPFFNKGGIHLIQGVLEAYQRNYTNFTDGQYFGEVIGKKLQGNPYHIVGHIWIPFEGYAKQHLMYNSWGKYPKTFESISNWFKNDLFSLYIRRVYNKIEPPEGIVFYHPDGRMAKIRRDMFDWYEGKNHKEKIK